MSPMTNARWSRATQASCSSASAVNTMLIVGVFADRLSHNFRSPLSVLRGFFDDYLNGYPVDEVGLRDASVAVERMLNLVNAIAAMALTSKPRLGLYRLSEVIDSLGQPLCGPVTVTNAGAASEAAYPMDLTLAQHAVRCVDAFLSSCLIGNSGERKLGRTAKVELNASLIRWSLVTKEFNFLHRYAECSRLGDVSELVSSPSALALFVAEAAMELNGLSSVVRVLEAGELQLELNFASERITA